MGILLQEHIKGKIILDEGLDELGSFNETTRTLSLPQSSFDVFRTLKSKSFRAGYYCYKIDRTEDEISIEADYFVGIDWLIPGVRYVYIEPKINQSTKSCFEKQLELEHVGDDEINALDEQFEKSIIQSPVFQEINYLKMLLDATSDDVVKKHCTDLVRIDWTAPHISVNQKQDQLTPFLVVQFLQFLKSIVRRGLKKSYYKVQENLNGRIKGKILVGQQIKCNIFKNRMTNTFCEYQVFGEDNCENRFLKKVLRFAISYIENNRTLFQDNRTAVEGIINYCRPVFEHIGDNVNDRQLNHLKHNPFFREYKETIKIGQHILKKFGNNITRTTDKVISTPPYWIDMPRLFELYVYQKLLRANPRDISKIKYQFSTYGNALDILIKNGPESIVIDAKYKLKYKHAQVHEDMRQVAGYARLNRVLKEVGFKTLSGDLTVKDPTVACLIIYPDVTDGLDLDSNHSLSLFSIDKLISEERKIGAYHKIYKLGVRLPFIV